MDLRTWTLVQIELAVRTLGHSQAPVENEVVQRSIAVVPDDRVTVVVLAGREGRVLPPMIADHRPAVEGRNRDIIVRYVTDAIHGLDAEHRAILVGRGLVDGAGAKVIVDLA